MSVLKKISFSFISCLWMLAASAQSPVGFKEVEIADTLGTGRALHVALWYPAQSRSTTTLQATQVASNRVFAGVSVFVDAPAQAGMHTVVLVSHGTFGHWGNQAWLAHALAQRGYVVAAPSHPGSSYMDKRPDQMQALWQRPSDLSRVLDAVNANPQWAGTVVPDRAAVAGHSLGAWTALVLAGGRFSTAQFAADCQLQAADYAPCAVFREFGVAKHPNHDRLLGEMKADPRIRVAVLLDIGAARGFTANSLSTLATPVLLIGAGQPNAQLPQAKETYDQVMRRLNARPKYQE